MSTLVRTLVVAAFSCGCSFAAATNYFKEDHLTGAKYIALESDGTYTITGREHMGVSVEESGRWRKSGAEIAFTPAKSGRSPYRAAEVTYRNYTFLSLNDDSGASIAVSAKETESNLDQNPKTLPPYVFFKVSAETYRRETKRAYAFRALPSQPIPEQLKVADAPRTARNVKCFRSFTTHSAMVDIVKKCGLPDEHQGSGIYIFLYDLEDGSIVAIGAADLNKLLYVNHIETGKSSSLLRDVQTK
jgi:hypothetical protein